MHRLLALATLCLLPFGAAHATTVRGSCAPSSRSRQEEVKITTSDKVELAGTYYAPRKGRAPGVLLIHDADGDRTQMKGLAERLNKSGFAVLAIDLRGHGESCTDKVDWNKCDEKSRSSMWQLSLRDVAAGADWILSQKDVHSTSLSLVGNGSGCALAARHAETDENVVALTMLSPKPKDFGFDVETSIQNVNGLPTLVLARRDTDSERMVAEANAMTNQEWITWMPVLTKKPTILDDKKTASKVAKWLADIAMPKKGRG